MISNKWYIIAVVMVFQTITILGQDRQVWLHGKVVRQSDGMTIPQAQIASYQKQNVFAANDNGEFKVILNKKDTIKVFALGFEPAVYFLDTLSVDPDVIIIFPLEETTYQIQQVDINSDANYNAYLAQLRADREKQKEMNLGLPSDIKLGQTRAIPADLQPIYASKPPIIAAVLQPLSFVHYYTSKSERTKVKLLKLMDNEKQLKLLTRELVQQISGYDGVDLDAFIMYCNGNIKLSKKDTQLSIKYKVIDLYEAYKQNK